MLERKRVRSQEDDADVNVTPLLDIVFIMLIFFIVTATFVNEDGFAPRLPEPSPEQPDGPPPPSLQLYVQANGQVRVDGGREIDPRSVKSVAEEFFATNPEKGVVQVTADLKAKSGVVILAVDQARDAHPNPNAAPIVVSKASATE